MKRTRIEDIAVAGASLSDAQMRLVAGGGGGTCTADSNTCDEDGSPGRGGPHKIGGAGNDTLLGNRGNDIVLGNANGMGLASS